MSCEGGKCGEWYRCDPCRIEELEVKLRTARAEALEEAARMVEGCLWFVTGNDRDDFAAAIRALKDKP